MVRRWIFIILGATGLLLLSLAVGTGYWLLARPEGSRWLLHRLAEHSGMARFARVEGTLVDGLLLHDLEVTWPDGELTVRRLQFTWQPAELWRGRVGLPSLTGDGVRLELRESETPEPPLDWRLPPLPSWARWLRGSLDYLLVTDLQVTLPSGRQVTMTSVSGRLFWTGARLVVPRLTLLGPEQAAATALELDLVARRLHWRATAQWQQPAGPLRLALRTELQERPAGQALDGRLWLFLRHPQVERARLRSRLTLVGRQLSLEDLQARVAPLPEPVTGRMALDMTGEQPRLKAELGLRKANLQAFTDLETDLDVQLAVQGWLDDFQGRLELANRGPGWRNLTLSGAVQGDGRQVSLTSLRGRWLQGELSGKLDFAWQPELTVGAELQGRGVQLTVLQPQWPQDLAVSLTGEARRAAEDWQGRIQLQVPSGRWRGHRFQARGDARFAGTEVDFRQLEVQGDRLSVRASGRLQERLAVQLRVGELAGLVPETSGTLQADGWLRYREQNWQGSLTGRGDRIRFRQYGAEGVSLAVDWQGVDRPGSIDARLAGVTTPFAPLNQARLQATGTLRRHSASLELQDPPRHMRLSLDGGWDREQWQGRLQSLSLHDGKAPWSLLQPAELTVSAEEVRVAGLRLAGSGDERLELDGRLAFADVSGALRGGWRQMDLARLDAWTPGLKWSGRSQGQFELQWPAQGAPELALQADLQGAVAHRDGLVDLHQVTLRTLWNRSGLDGDLAADLGDAGRAAASWASGQPAGRAWPEQIDWSLQWRRLDLRRFAPWFPEGWQGQGLVSGQGQGQWYGDGRWTLSATTDLTDGRLDWQRPDGHLSLSFERAVSRWDWRDDRLTGDLELTLADHGRLEGNWRLPLPARWPLAPVADPLQARLRATLQERGLLASLFPGLIQETAGRLQAQVDVTGTWEQPRYGGRLQLDQASAYLPAAGIELRDIALQGRLVEDRLLLDSWSVVSGGGRLQGSGSCRLEQWRPTVFQLSAEGQNFQAVRLPELQLSVSPQLTLDGDLETLRVRGTVKVPEMLIADRVQPVAVRPSPDVILEGAPVDAAQKSPIALDARIRLELGDRVLVKAAGLDARLQGAVDLWATDLQRVTAQGRISVAEGAFSAYGVKLQIERGHLQFSGGPVEQPSLDLLALRTVGQVKSGVRVTGTPRDPFLQLYSEPSMSDTDQLSYIVLGRPLVRSSGDTDLLMAAAGALLAQGESVVLQDRLKSQLGLDVLGIESGNGELEAAMVTIGKYLSPNLYVGFGQALFGDSSELRLRYSFGKHWEVESKTGTESGIDLYYRIEFR